MIAMQERAGTKGHKPTTPLFLCVATATTGAGVGVALGGWGQGWQDTLLVLFCEYFFESEQQSCGV